MQDPTAVPTPVNQFAITGGPNIEGQTRADSYMLALGHMTPPMLPANLPPEQMQEILSSQPILISSVGLFEFTEPRLRHLRDVLNNLFASLDGANE